MMKQVFSTCVLLAIVQAFAVPVIDQSTVTICQSASREVTVSYRLTGSEPAIVTMDVQTNAGDNVWASIGAENFTRLSGAVNRLVTGTGVQTIQWKARKDWPDRHIDGGKVRAVVTAWPTNAPPDYMVVDLSRQGAVFWYASETALPYGPISNDVYKTSLLVMKRIPAANETWRKGSPSWEVGSGSYRASENPHYVTLTKDYYMGVYALTVAQYSRIMTGTESTNKKPQTNLCVDGLRGSNKGRGWPTSADIDEDCTVDKLRKLAGNGVAFDLPTDAQWEFACRGGAETALYNGCDLTSATSDENSAKIAWTKQNSGNALHDVGGRAPNAFGLYDMLGNCYEWCIDYFVTAAPTDFEIDPKGVESAQAEKDSGSPKHQLRGGAYNHDPERARCAFRHYGNGQDKPGDTRGCRLCWTLP